MYYSTEFEVMSSLKPFQVTCQCPKCQAALNQAEGCPAREPAAVVTNRGQGALGGGQAGVVLHPSCIPTYLLFSAEDGDSLSLRALSS